jgi:hypothetical protein
MNENITAVDRRRTGRKRATGVAFGALVGTVLTILAPGLTSSASAAEVEAWDSPGTLAFDNGTRPDGTHNSALLRAAMGSTREGYAAAHFVTGKAIVGADTVSGLPERVTATYSLQESPAGATTWTEIGLRTATAEVVGRGQATIDGVSFPLLRYGGTHARYRLVATFNWADRTTSQPLSKMKLTTRNAGDYECGATKVFARKSLSCAVDSVDNQFGINLS